MKLRFQVLLTTLSKTTKHVGVFVLGIVMARKLPIDTYGTFLQVQLIVNTLLYAAIFGIPHSIYYFLPRVRSKKQFLYTTSAIMLTLATVVSVLAYLLVPWLSEKLNNAELSGFATVIGLFLFFQIPIKMFEPAMISAKRVPVFVVVNTTFNIAFFLTILIPLLLEKSLADIFNGLIVFYVCQFAVIAAALGFAGRSMIDDLEGEEYDVRQQLAYSLPIGFSGAIGEVARQIDKIIISIFFNPYQYAIYTRGALQIPLLNVISHSLHNILMPNFVAAFRNNDIPTLLKTWHSAMRLMAFFVYPAFAFFVVTADMFIPALFSDKYAEASIIFQIYMFTLLRRITSGDSIIRAIGRTGVLFKLTMMSVTLNVVLTYFLVKNFGVIGAPIGTVISTYVVFALYLSVVSKLLDVPVSRLIPWNSLGKILGLSVGSVAVASFVRLFGFDRLTTLLVMFAVFGAIYLIFLRIFRILSHYERSAIQGVIPKQLRWII